MVKIHISAAGNPGFTLQLQNRIPKSTGAPSVGKQERSGLDARRWVVFRCCPVTTKMWVNHGALRSVGEVKEVKIWSASF